MQQTNKKLKFNVIDILITAIILVVIAFVAYIFVFSSNNFSGSDKVNIQFTIEIKEERDELIPNAEKNIGATLVEGTQKYALGEVVDFYHESATYSTFDKDGNSVAAVYPEHSNVYFVVNAEADVDNTTGRYSINGFELSVGTLVYARLPHYAGTSYCTQIVEIGK